MLKKQIPIAATRRGDPIFFVRLTTAAVGMATPLVLFLKHRKITNSRKTSVQNYANKTALYLNIILVSILLLVLVRYFFKICENLLGILN